MNENSTQQEVGAVASTESENSVTEEKRHRGRPRKYERDETGKPILPPELDDQGNPLPKRHRGRPKKEIDETKQVKEPKKRGRPRKNPLPDTVVPDEDANKNISENNMPQDVANTASKQQTEETKPQIEQKAEVTKPQMQQKDNPVINLFAGMVSTETKAKYHNFWKYSTLRRLHENRVRYTVLMVTEHKDGTIKQFNIHETLLTPLMFFIVLLLLVLGITGVYKSSRIHALRANNMDQASLIQGLEDDNSRLEVENTSLQDKVAVLSDTVKKKMEEEQALQQAKEEESLPKGLPIDTNAGIEENTTEDSNDPIVLFTAAEGSNVIASGSGTVVAVEADAEYGTRIKVDHGNGYISIYRNAGEAKVKNGDEIVRGWILFVIGEENTSLGYQVQENGSFINPVDVMEING
ncbi:MAG: peptidoglycan DD-metalloendopeptidase family protein [Lachnospiraceae bacterium]|nr:peptidoglycan DD-metalloendopeptidase family protein [Lachnospiraceae bacterium]